MKRYSFRIRGLREADAKVERFLEDPEALMTSEEFKEFRGYVEDFARYKRVKGRRFGRSTDYAAIGIMTINDLYQEAYLAFLEAYEEYKKRSEDFVEGGAVWSYLKKTTILNFEKSIRGKKDSIRMPERVYFADGNNVNVITSIFGNLEEVFRNNVEEVATSKWETDLVGSFMDVHMDDYLDLTREGNRDLRKNERSIVKMIFGLDGPKMSYREIADYYKISQSTIRSVKERAIKRLQEEESKEKIADFLHEYRVGTQADIENYKK